MLTSKASVSVVTHRVLGASYELYMELRKRAVETTCIFTTVACHSEGTIYHTECYKKAQRLSRTLQRGYENHLSTNLIRSCVVENGWTYIPFGIIISVTTTTNACLHVLRPPSLWHENLDSTVMIYNNQSKISHIPCLADLCTSDLIPHMNISFILRDMSVYNAFIAIDELRNLDLYSNHQVYHQQ